MAFHVSMVLLSFGAFLLATDAIRTKLTNANAQSSATSGFEGYLWRTGNDLRFKWSDKPIVGDDVTIYAKVAPASVVKDWELTGSTKNIKNSVNYPEELHTGFANFLRMCRKKGITVTLETTAVKLFFFNEGQRITKVEAGGSANVQEYEYVGIIDGESEGADDLDRIESVQWLVFKDAIDKAKGNVAKLDQYDNLQKLTTFHEKYTANSQAEIVDDPIVASSSEVSEDISSNEVSQDSENTSAASTPGCYLIIEKVSGAAGGFTLASMYSKDGIFGSKDKVPVGFFEPSEAKVEPSSWKYTKGNRKVFMRGTLTGDGKFPKAYLQHYASFMNEGRKMEGKFTLLPDAQVKVIFMIKDGPGRAVPTSVNEPVDLMDKDLVAVLNEDETELDSAGWTVNGFTAQARKLGFLFSWSTD